MPARVADSPGTVPFQLLIVEFGLCEPKHEIRLVALVVILFNALANAVLKILFFKIVEHVVVFELRSVKIDISARLICVSGVHKLFNDLYELTYAGSGRLHHVGTSYVKAFAVREKRVGVKLCYLHHRLVLALCALEHFILALVGIARKVSHVRNVHNALYVISDVAQISVQNILHDVCSQIADMGKMIHGRAAGVHRHLAGCVRNKLLFFVRQ